MATQEDKLPGCPLWVLTFGDCMSLLMTFFVMICAFTNFDEQKTDSMLGSLQQSLGFAGEGRMERYLKRISALMVKNQQLEKDFVRRGYISDGYRQEKLFTATQEMVQRLTGMGMYDFITISYLVNGLSIRIHNAALFAPGSTTIVPKGQILLKEVALMAGVVQNNLVVEGHADSEETVTAAGVLDPWSLSTARAVAVAEALQRNGIRTERIAARTCGDVQPLEEGGDSPAAREANRRVEIIIQPWGLE